MSATTTTTNNNNKELLHTTTQPTAYPSPSLSPATSHHPNTQQLSSTASRPRQSVKALLTSSNPPASPLDALVMALEATVDEDHNHIQQEAPDHLTDQDDDPDATIPSSPTMFMKRAPGESSLHHLPTMMLPESAASTLTQSTQPHGLSSARGASQRKMSISSQDSSSSSVNSNSERTKEYACTVGSCEKKFYQVAHLRSHERRCHSGARPYIELAL
ncbi:hypothetical protein BGZ79_000589 [Entomortierella chlamydospora]|nr:hypothetical protein BGZ79_000589 [Entomortierella chlamydospora]